MIRTLPITGADAGLKLDPPRGAYTLRKMARAQDDEKAIREQVGKFVNGTFFGMMMKAMRKTVPEGGMMSGGRGEEVFREFLDHEMAEKMSAREDFPLVEATVRQLRGMREYRQKMPWQQGDPAMAKVDRNEIAIAK